MGRRHSNETLPGAGSGTAASQPSRRAVGACGAAFVIALAVAATALADSGGHEASRMVVNAAADHYRQDAVRGVREHSFSPLRPPHHGRFIYGHWTPYDPPPPDSLPSGAVTHVIVPGDTLWDIAAGAYQDPLLWPYLWEANPWVTYPHWIHPGDVLHVPPLMILPAGELLAQQLSPIMDAYRRAGLEMDVYCGHFVVPPGRRFFGEIVDQEEDPPNIGLATGAVVYVNVGAKDGVLPGDEFAIVFPPQHVDVSVTERRQKDEQLEHPMTHEKLGVVMQMAGRLRILLLGEEISTARITTACDAVEIGHDIYPFSEVPVPLVPPTAERERYFNELPERGRGFVVWQDRSITWSGGELVTIDLGSSQGVIPGDSFRIYRDFEYDWRDIGVNRFRRWWNDRAAVEKMKRKRDPGELGVFGKQRPIPDSPPRIIGELVVLYAETDTATARVLWTNREVLPGDRLVYLPVETGLSRVVAFESADVTPGVPFSHRW